MIRPVANYSRISTKFGDRPDPGRFGRHAGTDYACPTGTKVVSPISGKVTLSTYGSVAGHQVEVTGGGLSHRLLHLSRRDVSVGQTVQEGQQIGLSGASGSNSTGAHCHWDVRKAGTAWSASFSNYQDPEELLKKHQLQMPAVGSKIKLERGTVRTTFRAGTTSKAGAISVKDDSYIYTVRGYDSKYPGRIIINSRSAGGDGVALALYYLSGNKIDGWKAV